MHACMRMAKWFVSHEDERRGGVAARRRRLLREPRAPGRGAGAGGEEVPFSQGQVLGVAKRSIHIALGTGLAMAVIGATVEATGGLQSRTQSDWNKLLPSSYNKDGAEQ